MKKIFTKPYMNISNFDGEDIVTTASTEITNLAAAETSVTALGDRAQKVTFEQLRFVY